MQRRVARLLQMGTSLNFTGVLFNPMISKVVHYGKVAAYRNAVCSSPVQLPLRSDRTGSERLKYELLYVVR